MTTTSIRRVVLTRPRFAKRRQDGFALIATLWLSVAIASVALAFALEAHTVRVSTANLGESTQALAAARAGIATTLARLDYLSANGTLPPGATPTMSVSINKADPWQWADSILAQRVDLGGGAGYTVQVRDAGATLDVNRATATEWRNFLYALQIDASLADRLAQEITDWRDVDDNAQGEGAERDVYVSARRMMLPTNRNFGSLDELRDVLDMTPAVYDTIAPYLTIAGTGQVSVNTAPAPILRTVPEFTDEVVAAILARRSSGGRMSSIQDLSAQVSGRARRRLQGVAGLQGRWLFSTRAVEIISTGWAPGGRTRATSTVQVVTGTGGNNVPLASIQWRREE